MWHAQQQLKRLVANLNRTSDAGLAQKLCLLPVPYLYGCLSKMTSTNCPGAQGRTQLPLNSLPANALMTALSPWRVSGVKYSAMYAVPLQNGSVRRQLPKPHDTALGAYV